MRLHGSFSLFLACAALAVLAGSAHAGAIIENGTVRLGVNDHGDLNFTDRSFAGVTFVPTGNDGTRAGCPCEGWGAGNGSAAEGGVFSGWANRNEGGANNLDLVSFTSDATSATSVTTIDDKLEITQRFAPAPETPNLYEVRVTLKNIGAARLGDVRYTRLMDWDIEPTAFSEFVTIRRGTASTLLFSNNNGFLSGDPFEARSPTGGIPAATVTNVDFTDVGPSDHGALFDFGFGALDPGASTTFRIYYGAAPDEATADTTVSKAALEMFSYGQPNLAPPGEPVSSVSGAPNTFIFGFRAVGGKPIIPPVLTLDPASQSRSVGETAALTATLKDSGGNPVSGSPLVFQVAGANPQAAKPVTSAADGTAPLSYAGAAGGTDTVTVCIDSDGNGACDANDPITTTATVTWSSVVAQVAGSGVALSKKSCASRRSFSIRLRERKGQEIESAVVRVNGKKVATRRGKRLTAPVNLKGLPSGKFTVEITAKLKNGKTKKGKRTYNTCAKKRKGGKITL